MKRKEFKTKRLILRPAKSSDFKAWFEAYGHCLPKKNKWDRGPLERSKLNKKFYTKLMKEYETLAKKDEYYRYFAFETKTGQMVGLLDFNIHVRHQLQNANFGYRIYNRHWGKGFGQEAAAAGLIIGFKQLKLHRLEAAIDLDNKKSIRLAKAIGMCQEGIRKKFWFEDGKWRDQLMYVAIPEDIGLKSKKPSVK